MHVSFRNGEFVARQGEDFATGGTPTEAKARLGQQLRHHGSTRPQGRFKKATLMQEFARVGRNVNKYCSSAGSSSVRF